MKYFSKIWDKKDTSNIKEYEEETRTYIEELKKLNSELTEKDEQICSIQEDYKKIFNLFSDMVIILDDNGYIIDLNVKAQNILKDYIRSDSLIGSNWKEVIESFGCTWDKTIERKAISNGVTHELTKEVFIDNLGRYCLVSIIPIRKPEYQDYFIVVMKDITSIKLREMSLIKKQKMIGYITSITDMFSRNLNINYILDKVVETLSDIDGVDVVYIYKNCESCHEQAKKIREFYKADISISISDIIKYKDFPRWIEYFNLNHIVCGNINDFPKNERQLLMRTNIKSICIVPIYTPVGFWGFLGFDSYIQDKRWVYDEEQLLKVAANIIGGELYKWSLRNINSDKVEDIIPRCINY